jgi:hypothetical protein
MTKRRRSALTAVVVFTMATCTLPGVTGAAPGADLRPVR